VMQSAPPAAPTTTTTVFIITPFRLRTRPAHENPILRSNRVHTQLHGLQIACKEVIAIDYILRWQFFPPRSQTDLSHQHVFVGAARYYFNLVAAGLYMHTDVACRLLFHLCVFQAKCNLENLFSVHGNCDLSRDQTCFCD
jgi:hypothetical protein